MSDLSGNLSSVFVPAITFLCIIAWLLSLPDGISVEGLGYIYIYHPLGPPPPLMRNDFLSTASPPLPRSQQVHSTLGGGPSDVYLAHIGLAGGGREPGTHRSPRRTLYQLSYIYSVSYAKGLTIVFDLWQI